MVTPFAEDRSVDEAAARKLARHLIEHGSNGLVLSGTTGESPTLTDEEKISLLRAIRDELGPAALLIAGTGSNDTRHSERLSAAAADAGADAVLAVTPYYNKPNRRGIIEHFKVIAAATDKPVVIYNIPSRCVIDLPNELLAELAQIDNIAAVKQARYEDVEAIEGMDLLAGNDEMLAHVMDVGGTGGILVASHLVGREMRRMIDEPDARAQILADLKDLFEALFVTSNPIPLKAAMRLAGHDVGDPRLPLVAASEEETAVVREALEHHGLLAAV